MFVKIEAACSSNIGKFRNRNSDNFLFDNRSLPMGNEGIKKAVVAELDLCRPVCLGIFDGMDAEQSGAVASYTAAQTLKLSAQELTQYIIPGKQFLKRSCEAINKAVYSAAQDFQGASLRTTAVLALLDTEQIYICNLGDSRAYRMRGCEFLQLSRDHIERLPFTETEMRRRKAEMKCFLGSPLDETAIAPYIAKGELKLGDWYLLCSNGLTDMLSNFEISCLMHTAKNAGDCVNSLIRAALENGGLDNVSVIVCRVIK